MVIQDRHLFPLKSILRASTTYKAAIGGCQFDDGADSVVANDKCDGDLISFRCSNLINRLGRDKSIKNKTKKQKNKKTPREPHNLQKL